MMSVSGNMVDQWCLVENAKDTSGNNIDGETIRTTSSVDGNFGEALDETGRKLFNAGEIDVLKNEVNDSDLQKLMLAVITEEEESIDPKD